MKNLLIVDDNDRYAQNLMNHFTKEGWNCDRACTAKEGWNMYISSKSNSSYNMIVTDITMETQISGLWFIRRVHKDGFQGTKIIATTGFDVPGVIWISRWILPLFAGVSFMIPKVPLKEGKVILIPCT